LAEQKIKRLLEISIRRDDTRYFRRTRVYPFYKETGEGPIVALGDVGSVYKAMEGDAAAFAAAWIPHGAITWYRITGNKDALELARSLVQYVYRYGKVIEDQTGRFLAPSDGIVTPFLISALSYGLAVQDHDLVKWVHTAFDPYLRSIDTDRTGVINRTIRVDDVIQLATMLTQAGAGNYWEDIDRLTRNSLLAMQYVEEDIDRAMHLPVTRAGDPNNTGTVRNLAYHMRGKTIELNKPLPPGYFQPEDGTESCLGVMHFPNGGRTMATGDGSANKWRGLYYVWDKILEPDGQGLRVNLLMNRASPWADLDSYIPYEGKAVIKMKTHSDDVQVRIPEWTNWNEVSCDVNGKKRAYDWSTNGYVRIGKVQAGDKVTVAFPMKQWVVATTAPQYVSKEKKPWQVTLKGNTVIDLSESMGYPLFLREKFRVERAPTKRVTRFVSKERFFWW
jgi:hypothetical protein